jgi:molybdopterin synthase catalytic subunit
MRRETSRVSFLMCPFCVRGLVSAKTTLLCRDVTCQRTPPCCWGIRPRGCQGLYLEYEAYEGMAEEVMADLADALKARHDHCEVDIHDRIGRVDIGETSVVVAVSAPYRAAALTACHKAIDELKVTVPLWKKEVYKEAKSGSAAGHESRQGQACANARPDPVIPRFPKQGQQDLESRARTTGP